MPAYSHAYTWEYPKGGRSRDTIVYTAWQITCHQWLHFLFSLVLAAKGYSSIVPHSCPLYSACILKVQKGWIRPGVIFNTSISMVYNVGWKF